MSFGVRNGRGVDSVDEVLIGNNWGVLTSLPSFHGPVTVQSLWEACLTVTVSSRFLRDLATSSLLCFVKLQRCKPGLKTTAVECLKENGG